MVLDFGTIIPAVFGTVKITEDKDRLWLYRFSDAQMEAYRTYSSDFFKKTKACAGIRLEFSTDSTSFTLCGDVISASSRKFYGFDVYVNGALVKHTLEPVKNKYVGYSLKVDLGDFGKKNVRVYFPWSVQANIASLTIDDGASFEPIVRPYKMLCFGDSITHGYDALNPSFSYANRLADALCADHINKGIGGEVFFPRLAELKDDVEPDYITVAYGTNDWVNSKKDVFDRDSRLFYEILSKNYPNVKIFALSPVWRGDMRERITSIGEFSYVSKTLEAIADSLENVTFIDCLDAIPHDVSFYVNDRLHPNDGGFYQYAANLYAEIKKSI